MTNVTPGAKGFQRTVKGQKNLPTVSPSPRSTDLRLPRAVIFDVDGTLADTTTIRHHISGDKKKRNFEAFHTESVNVPPHDWVVHAAQDYADAGYHVLVVTARAAKWRPHTAFWLAMHDIPSHAMMMRRDGDQRPDYEVKRDMLEIIRRSWIVVRAYDDNPAILDLWAKEGIPSTTVPGWDD